MMMKKAIKNNLIRITEKSFLYDAKNAFRLTQIFFKRAQVEEFESRKCRFSAGMMAFL